METSKRSPRTESFGIALREIGVVVTLALAGFFVYANAEPVMLMFLDAFYR